MVGEGAPHEPHNSHRMIQQHPIFNTQDYLDFAERQRLEGVEVETLLAEPSSALRTHAPAIAAGYKALADRQEASIGHLVQRLNEMELLIHRLVQAQRTQSESQQATIQAMHTAQQNAWRDQQKAWTDWMQAMIAGAAALRPSAPPPLPAMPPPPPPLSAASLPPLSSVQSALGPRPSAAAGPSTPAQRASTAGPVAGPSSAAAASGSGSVPRRRERSDSEESDGHGNETGGDSSMRSDKPPRKRKAPENTTPMHSLNPTVTTIQQAWDEYWNGYAGAPSLRSLELKHGTAWCGGHGHAMRKAFKRRLRILARIEAVPEHEQPAKIQQLQAIMGTRSLDWLAKDPTALLAA